MVASPDAQATPVSPGNLSTASSNVSSPKRQSTTTTTPSRMDDNNNLSPASKSLSEELTSDDNADFGAVSRDDDEAGEASECEILTDDEEEEEEDEEVDGRNSVQQDRAPGGIAQPPPLGQRAVSDSADVLSPRTSTAASRKPSLPHRLSSPKKLQGSPPNSAKRASRRRISSTDIILSPLTPLRTMKALAAMGTNGGNRGRAASLSVQIPNLDSDDEEDGKMEEESDSGESFLSVDDDDDDDDESDVSDNVVDELADFHLDGDESARDMFFGSIDWSQMSYLPTSFLNSARFGDITSSAVKEITNEDMASFVAEHYLMVKGLVQLLAEREWIGIEADIELDDNIIKKGSLKKRFAKKIYFVKYVEIRKGNLCYYEDSNKKGEDTRKVIHLRRHTCRCKASPRETMVSNLGGGFGLDLIVEGAVKTRWLAKSEEERDAWIRAINQAMVGDVDDNSDTILDLAAYQEAIDLFRSFRSSLEGVETLSDYKVGVQSMLYNQRALASLRLPNHWLRQEVTTKSQSGISSDEAPQIRVKSSIASFWKNLASSSFLINGHVLDAHSPFSGPRVIGALTRSILEFDKCDPLDERFPASNRTKGATGLITDVDATSYARTILAAVLRSKERDDALSTIENLFANDQLVKIVRSGIDPIQIDVSFAGDDYSEYEGKNNDVCGWVMTRTRRNKRWRERYFVVSEGVLSHYENSDPRPYGLRGQVVLSTAVLEPLDGNVLVVHAGKRDQARELKFENRGDFIRWREMLTRAIAASAEKSAASASLPEADTETPESSQAPKSRKSQLLNAGKLLKGAAGGGIKVVKGATAGGLKVVKGATSAGMKSIKGSYGLVANSIRSSRMEMKRRRMRPQLDMLMTSTRNITQNLTQKREPSVQVVVEWTQRFEVEPLPDESKSSDDHPSPIVHIHVKLFQAFLLAGGNNGRIGRGDELVEMKFLDGPEPEGLVKDNLEPHTLL